VVSSRFILLLAWSCLIVGFASAQEAEGPTDGELLLSEDFDAVPDGGLPDGWTARKGTWSVEGGRLIGDAMGEYNCALTAPVGALTDVAIEADLCFLDVVPPPDGSSRWASVMGRCSPGETTYFVHFVNRWARTAKNGQEIAIWQDGKWTVPTTCPVEIEPAMDDTHRLRLELRGRRGATFLDGQRILMAEPLPGKARTGEAGILASNCKIAVDNVSIFELPPGPEIPLGPPRPLVIAHRGDSASAPENTLRAIGQAFDRGADLVEIDVRLTKDEKVVLMHDDTVDRTTDGTGKVAEMTLEELRALNASWPKNEKFADVDAEPVPTLEEALQLAKGRGMLALDIAQGMEGEILACPWTLEGAEALSKVLPGTGIAIIGSAPNEFPPAFFADVSRRGVRCFWYNHASITDEFVREAHRRAMSVIVWTLDDPGSMEVARDRGVDGILSNDTALAISALEAAEE